MEAPREPREGRTPSAGVPFPSATGDGVRVAVIDSGVFANHPHISRVTGGISIGSDGAVTDGDYVDRLGHGTAVMAAIQEKAPAAAYFAVKVFQAELRTTGAALLGAIDWCVENDMHVVNMSLGSTNHKHAEFFAEAARRAIAQGIVLTAALKAGDEPCYPGCLPEVIGVGLDWDCPRDGYWYDGETGSGVFMASGYPRPVPGVAPARNLHGISFAVANATGFVARASESVLDQPVSTRCASVRAALVEAAMKL
jgi:hypothetical protein